VTTLVETCGDRFGAAVEAETGVPLHQWLFSESPSRVVVSVAPDRVDDLAAACRDADLVCVRLGTVTAARRLTVGAALHLDLDEVAAAQARVLPDLFGDA